MEERSNLSVNGFQDPLAKAMPDAIQEAVKNFKKITLSRNDKTCRNGVMVVAGSINNSGPVLLSGKAVLRAGTDFVRLGIPGSLYGTLAGHLPEANWLLLPNELGSVSEGACDVIFKNLDGITALLIGPGLGDEEKTFEFIRGLFEGKAGKTSRGAIGFLIPAHNEVANEIKQLPSCVVESDGVLLLSRLSEWQQHVMMNMVLCVTREELISLIGVNKKQVTLEDTTVIAGKFAKDWKKTILLKEAGRLSVYSPEGYSTQVDISPEFPMRAGSGSILAGIVAGLLAQGLKPYEASLIASWNFRKAIISASQKVGFVPAVMGTDILETLAGSMQN